MDAYIAKIKKLLALANDPAAAENERETARRQAESLMAKHKIDEAEVLLADGRTKPTFDLTRVEVSATPHYPGHSPKEVPAWVSFIAFGVAILTETRVSAMHRNYKAFVRFSGTVSDTAFAAWLFEALCKQCYAASRKAVAGMGAKEASDYRNGYAMSVQVRLKQMAASVNGQCTSTALVVVDAKKQAIDEAFGEQQSKTRQVDYSAMGRRDGQNAVLPTSRVVGTTNHNRLTA